VANGIIFGISHMANGVSYSVPFASFSVPLAFPAVLSVPSPIKRKQFKMNSKFG